MITIALRKRTLSPVRLVLKVTFFCCYLPQWCFFVFLGVLTRLDYKQFSLRCILVHVTTTYRTVLQGSWELNIRDIKIQKRRTVKAKSAGVLRRIHQYANKLYSSQFRAPWQAIGVGHNQEQHTDTKTVSPLIQDHGACNKNWTPHRAQSNQRVDIVLRLRTPIPEESTKIGAPRPPPALSPTTHGCARTSAHVGR